MAVEGSGGSGRVKCKLRSWKVMGQGLSDGKDLRIHRMMVSMAIEVQRGPVWRLRGWRYGAYWG